MLGLAITARGQDIPLAPVEASVDTVDGFLRLLQAGGLPGILGLMGWMAGRWGGIPVAASIHLHAEDREILKSLIKPKEGE